MRQPRILQFLGLLPIAALLVVSLGCNQAGVARSRPAAEPALASRLPLAGDASKTSTKSRLFARRDKSPASLATQSKGGDAPSAAQQPSEQAPSVQSVAPSTSVVAPADTVVDCDYWIVSSRNCSGPNSSCDSGYCLSFYHRLPDQEPRPATRETFLASIRPDRPVCFVVHGSYNWWGDVMVESRRINRWIRAAAPGLPVQVVFFTWPSDGNMPYAFPVDIAILGRRSAAHAFYLASLMAQLPAHQRVAVLGHSHGARATVAALHLLGGGTLEKGQALPPGHAVPRHLRAVLIAAAIDHDWLNPGGRYGQALAVPERVLLMHNSRDATLGVYPMRKGVGPRALGRGGLGQGDRFALGTLGSKVVELNAADFAAWHHSFAAYHEHPELASAVVPYVYFQDDASPTTNPTQLPERNAVELRLEP